MTAEPQACRLLARLVEEAEIEREPIAEVRADLAALGIDPAGSVALARRLAAAGPSPARELLERIERSESLDDDLRRLERVDISDVRRQLPGGDSAAAVAHAHRASGRDSNVVGLRRRRSRRLLYGLSGVAAALAASVVLYVGMSPQPLRYAEPEAAQPATPVGESDNLQARMQPAADAPEPLIEAQPVAEPPSLSVSSDAATEIRMDRSAKSPEQAPAAPSSVAEEFAAEFRDQNLVIGGGAGQPAEAMAGDAKSNFIARPFGIAQPILALLVVDPRLVLPGFRRDDYAAGQLASRLDDARRLAAGRPIVALVTLQMEDGLADAVILALSKDARLRELAADEDIDVEIRRGEGAVSDYDILLLDRR